MKETRRQNTIQYRKILSIEWRLLQMTEMQKSKQTNKQTNKTLLTNLNLKWNEISHTLFKYLPLYITRRNFYEKCLKIMRNGQNDESFVFLINL